MTLYGPMMSLWELTWQIKQQSCCKSCSSCGTEKDERFVWRKVSLFLAFDRDSSTQLKRSYLLYLGFSRLAWQPSTLEQLSFSNIDSLRGSQVTHCTVAEPHLTMTLLAERNSRKNSTDLWRIIIRQLSQIEQIFQFFIYTVCCRLLGSWAIFVSNIWYWKPTEEVKTNLFCWEAR